MGSKHTLFLGFFRAGEITTTCTSTSSYNPGSHLSLDDIAVDNPAAPSILQVHLKVSKTDPFRKGIDVYIGRTNNGLNLPCSSNDSLPRSER